MKLRTDQRNAVDAVVHSKARSVLIVAPTGTGKTEVYAEIARQFAAQGKRVLVLAHRGEILDHGADRLRAHGLTVGIIRAGLRHLENAGASIQMASVQTLCRRSRRPTADVVIVDEAHHSPAKSYRKILANYPGARVVGLTATPIYNGRASSIADCFDEMHQMIEIADAVDRGVLAPVTGSVWLRKVPGLESVKLKGGDFDVAQLGKVMSRKAVVGSIVASWKRAAKKRSTIVFCATRRQAVKVSRAFRKAGVRAEYLDGTARRDHRAAVLARFDAGEFPVLVNVELFTEGVNVPRAKCIILARPTYSVTKFLQMVGRGRRPWNGEKCLIHDHAGVLGTHGHPDDPRDWALGGTSGKAIVICPKCQTARGVDVLKCPEGCTFKGHSGPKDPAVELRGYRYAVEDFAVRKSELIRRYLAGENPAQLGRVFNRDPSGIRMLLLRAGIKMRTGSESQQIRHGTFDGAKRIACLRLVRAGSTCTAAGKRVGVSHGVVARWANEAGITIDRLAAVASVITKATPEICSAVCGSFGHRSSGQVAKEFALSKSTVLKIWRAAGLRMSKSEARSLASGITPEVRTAVCAQFGRRSSRSVEEGFALGRGAAVRIWRAAGLRMSSKEARARFSQGA